MIKKLISIFIKNFFSNFINKILEKKNFVIIFRNGTAIGDHVYMSSILREIFLNHKKKIILFTNYYEFYLFNPRIYKLFKMKKKSPIWFFLRNLMGNSILEFRSIHDSKNEKHFLYYHKKNIHLAHANSEHFPLDLKYDDIKNEIFFSKNEINEFQLTLNLPTNFSLIHSTSKKSFTKNKEWSVEGMQSIVNYFDKIKWIQIGKKGEPELKNCKKMFDLNYRKLCYVISKCNFLVTYEGLFNHLASCFDKKNFIIHLGFLPIESFKYRNNIIIEKNNHLKCYPCYKLNCGLHQDFAKSQINKNFVINSIEDQI
ncbi:hypothetical protein [Candidatus Pelagibacter sp.]|uniref:hypothetical protein n=1 Tax=Candidatus Pelagibacter sp. TaxID=2024849 RepID=UPI003F8442C8